MRAVAHIVLRFCGLMTAVLLLNFALPRLLPGDPFDIDQDATGASMLTLSARQQLRSYYHLDDTPFGQFQRYLTDLGRGDFGRSISTATPVLDLIADRLPWTMALGGVASLIASTGGIALGMLIAWRRSPVQRFGERVVVAIAALPEFLVAIGVLLVFGVALRWFPISGGRTIFGASNGLGMVADIAWHLTLPVMALVVATGATFVLLTRDLVSPVLRAGYVTTARSKGIPEHHIAVRHVFPNLRLPLLTLAGLRVGQILGGAIVIERVFAIPGLGMLAIEAVRARDYPVIQAVFLLGSLGILVMNLLLELVHLRLGQRVSGS